MIDLALPLDEGQQSRVVGVLDDAEIVAGEPQRLQHRGELAAGAPGGGARRRPPAQAAQIVHEHAGLALGQVLA